jgi:hypothetical protein
MRATSILQATLREGAEILHAKRWSALWRSVTGLCQDGQLWLTALGRSLPGDTTDKHRIKAVDRLLGNSAIQLALPDLYAILAKFLLRGIRRPRILIDWTGGGSSAFAILTATLCFRGRAIAIYSRTFPVKRKSSPGAEREFLEALGKIVPSHCSPILVTDAGFIAKWFDSIREMGWDFVGRVRGTRCLSFGERWMRLGEVHDLAGTKAISLGLGRLCKTETRIYRIVLSKKRKLKGRHRLSFHGTNRQRTADRQRSAAAREPLLLITSLPDAAAVVVGIYDNRMQIEETFRDLKSHRYGWSLEDVRCRTPQRVDVLLLIAAFAAVAMHMIGFAARERKLDRGLQANTERKRPVFSTFFLGKLAMRRGLHKTISSSLLLEALNQIRQLVAQAALP